MPDINVLNETDSKLPPVPESPLSTQVSEPFTTGNNAAVTSCLLIPPLHSCYSGFLIIVVIFDKIIYTFHFIVFTLCTVYDFLLLDHQ